MKPFKILKSFYGITFVAIIIIACYACNIQSKKITKREITIIKNHKAYRLNDTNNRYDSLIRHAVSIVENSHNPATDTKFSKKEDSFTNTKNKSEFKTGPIPM